MQRQKHCHVGPVGVESNRFQQRRVNELRDQDRVLVVRLQEAEQRPIRRGDYEVPFVEVEVEVARKQQDRDRRDRGTGGDDDPRVADPHRARAHARAGTALCAG